MLSRIPPKLPVARTLRLPSIQARSVTTVPFRLPAARNEPNVSKMRQDEEWIRLTAQFDYIRGSPERAQLEKSLKTLKSQLPLESPFFVNGKAQSASNTVGQPIPSDHATTFTNYPVASSEQVNASIESALGAKKEWENTPFVDRVAIFQRAAELVTGKYRYDLIAATMLGQGKNIWQGEIDAAAELADFFRLNCNLAAELSEKQPDRGSPGLWT